VTCIIGRSEEAVRREAAGASVFQLKDEPEGTEKARIVMAPLWVDLWKESSRSRKVLVLVLVLGLG
jgi:hypothetical protein